MVGIRTGIGMGVGRHGANVKRLVGRNTDEVEAAGYLSIVTTRNLNLTSDGGLPGGTFYLQKNNINGIRQSGNLTKVQFYIGSNSGLPSKLIIAIYRKVGSVYNRIAYEDVLSKLTMNTANTITLTTPFPVLEGDYLCIGGNAGTATGGILAGITGKQAGSNKYKDVVLPDQGYAWDSQTSGTWVIPIKGYMQAPAAVVIGDSIVSAHGSVGASYIEDYIYPNVDSLVGHIMQVSEPNFVHQTMGIGGQTTTQIEARFAADVVALKPKMCIIEGGVNDIAMGSTKAIFIAKMTSMLNQCVAANIIPIVCKIPPWTNGTNAQLQARDAWMLDLQALVATYTGSVWVDFDVDMGKFRIGGNVDNLWDLQTDPDYDHDGVHPTLLGYQKIGEVLLREIKKKYRFV